VNAFLRDKTITFRPNSGFVISNRLSVKLAPSQLSSGEQQLLLLLCYVLMGRDEASIFMIDEPEISLNVKWQRQLVRSLLDLAKGTETQFLFASHSMELLAQHRSRVVQLTEDS
jgi:ABC-type glutathione transport system ATPase component